MGTDCPIQPHAARPNSQSSNESWTWKDGTRRLADFELLDLQNWAISILQELLARRSVDDLTSAWEKDVYTWLRPVIDAAFQNSAGTLSTSEWTSFLQTPLPGEGAPYLLQLYRRLSTQAAQMAASKTPNPPPVGPRFAYSAKELTDHAAELFDANADSYLERLWLDLQLANLPQAFCATEQLRQALQRLFEMGRARSYRPATNDSSTFMILPRTQMAGPAAGRSRRGGCGPMSSPFAD